MITLKKLVRKSISPPFKKTHPYTILPPLFYNLLGSSSSDKLEKKGSELCIYYFFILSVCYIVSGCKDNLHIEKKICLKSKICKP